MNEQVLSEISKKLDILIGLSMMRDINDESEKVLRLRTLGLDNQTIASLIGITKNAVATRISRSKPGRKKNAKE